MIAYNPKAPNVKHTHYQIITDRVNNGWRLVLFTKSNDVPKNFLNQYVMALSDKIDELRLVAKRNGYEFTGWPHAQA